MDINTVIKIIDERRDAEIRRINAEFWRDVAIIVALVCMFFAVKFAVLLAKVSP